MKPKWRDRRERKPLLVESTMGSDGDELTQKKSWRLFGFGRSKSRKAKSGKSEAKTKVKSSSGSTSSSKKTYRNGVKTRQKNRSKQTRQGQHDSSAKSTPMKAVVKTTSNSSGNSSEREAPLQETSQDGEAWWKFETGDSHKESKNQSVEISTPETLQQLESTTTSMSFASEQQRTSFSSSSEQSKIDDEDEDDFGCNDFDPNESDDDTLIGPAFILSTPQHTADNQENRLEVANRPLQTSSIANNGDKNGLPPQIQESFSRATTDSSCSSSTVKTLSFQGSSVSENDEQESRPTKMLLSRPFGRSSLPPAVARKWVVEVSAPEWEKAEQLWKYRILVQRRVLQRAPDASALGARSFTAACTWRSLENFVWLEKALEAEFQGGLLLPRLNIALGRPDLGKVTHEVDNTILRDWLSDIMNGIRGQGELTVDHESVDLLRSEAMEAFLYRNVEDGNTEPWDIPDGKLPDWTTSDGSSANQRATIPSNSNKKPSTQQSESFLSSVWNLDPMALLNMELCAGPYTGPQDTGKESSPRSTSAMDDYLCSSTALGSASTLDVQDSFLESSTVVSNSGVNYSERSEKHSQKGKLASLVSEVPKHYDLLKAENVLASSYKMTAISTLEKLDILLREEKEVGMAWKRFSIALSVFFSYEKDVESARLGDKSVNRERMPYRKISKASVDECLKLLAKEKAERSIPSLQAFRTMLVAFIGDLSSVEPSFDAYCKGVSQMQAAQEAVLQASVGQNRMVSPTENYWKGKLDALAGSAPILEEFSSKRNSSGISTVSSGDKNSSDHEVNSSGTIAAHVELMKKRLQKNENLLRNSLTVFCKTTSVRTSRMGWAYFNQEVNQSKQLLKAAKNLRKKLAVVDRGAVGKLISRHMEEEKEDDGTELQVIQKILNLGSKTHHSGQPVGSVGMTNHGDNMEMDSEKQHVIDKLAHKREKAIMIAQERIGRWDSKLGLAIMEAIGVDDPNIRVEETTRELRLVRKYAIGLRESLNRCVEALETLREVIVKGRHNNEGTESRSSVGHHKPIREARFDFLYEFLRLFGGTMFSEQAVTDEQRSLERALTVEGIDFRDPMAWDQCSKTQNAKRPEAASSCGETASSYVQQRGSQTEWLLSRLSDLLEDYNERVEVVESFVYMECVAIQMEKHFSKKRTEALTAFEKKTDITAAMNVAMKKRINKLVEELRVRLDLIPPEVTHTLVKETKEAHLASKNLKSSLHEIALRRLLRARETSTERVVSIMGFWAKEEEDEAISDLQDLDSVMEAIEFTATQENIASLVHRGN